MTILDEAVKALENREDREGARAELRALREERDRLRDSVVEWYESQCTIGKRHPRAFNAPASIARELRSDSEAKPGTCRKEQGETP